MLIELIPISECPDDVDLVLGWTLELWGDHIPGYSRQDWIDFYYKGASANYNMWFGDGQELIFIGKRGEEVVGAISLVDFDDLEEFRRLTPWVAAFIVNPKLRGEGIGTQMLELLENRCRSLGIKVLNLWTEDQSAFYEKRGYHFVSAGTLGPLTFEVLQKDLD